MMRVGWLTGHTLGHYQLLEPVGEGAVGTVYRAYLPNANRYAAIKILTAPLDDQRANYGRRFILEAETLAALQHPHIVPVYEYGVYNGLYFIVMQWLNGGTLHDRLVERTRQAALPSLGETAWLLQRLGEALSYAHASAIIHRDVKASNVMFDERGTPYLTDFGIAKLVDATTQLTAAGTILGTPAYMSPEQWRGDVLTPATDQYSLGILSYQLVTGQLPFTAPATHALMYQHLNAQPTPPDQLRTELPDAAAAVILRAMAKQPDERFATPAAFAEAFRRATDGVNTASTHFFTFPLAHIPPAPFLPHANTPILDNLVAEPDGHTPTPSPVRLPALRLSPLASAAIGVTLGVILLAVCVGTLTVGSLALVNRRATPDLPTAALVSEATADASTPDDGTLATAPTRLPGAVPFDGVQTQTPGAVIGDPALNAPASEDANGSANAGTLRLMTTLQAEDTSVRAVALSPDGIHLANGGNSNSVQIWDLRSRTQVGSLQGHTDTIYRVDYSPDGLLIASASADGTIRIWNSASGSLIHVLDGGGGDIRDVAFSPDGLRVAAAASNQEVRLWNVQTGALDGALPGGSERVLAVIFSTDGNALISGWTDNQIAVWQVPALAEQFRLSGHPQEVRALAVSPAGLLASGSADTTIRLWSLGSQTLVRELNGHGRDVYDIAFSPDGSLLASGGADNQVMLWDAQTGQMLGARNEHFGWVFDVDFSADGTQLASAGGDGTIRVWSY